MKRRHYFTLILLLALSLCLLAGCTALGGDDDNVHTTSYEPITGKFFLREATDPRIDITDTYFEIDGTEGNFSLKYYENGTLKKEGEMNRIVTREDKIGSWSDNLHLNVKCGSTYEHIGAYTESFEPINQFRILEEYRGGRTEEKYTYSELPFVLGTYVREGESFVKESHHTNADDYTVSTLANYTAELNGKFALDAEHYFYFISPRGFVMKDGPYLDSYFQYYAPGLDTPIEGFAHGITYESSYAPPRLFLTYSRAADFYGTLEDTEASLMFGYTTFSDSGRMIDHYGSISFSDGELRSFTFEHLSRSWTEEEWDEYTKSEEATLPDAIIYEYIGGSYVKE